MTLLEVAGKMVKTSVKYECKPRGRWLPCTIVSAYNDIYRWVCCDGRMHLLPVGLIRVAKEVHA